MLPYCLLLLFILFTGLLAREFAFKGFESIAPLVAINCMAIALMAGLRAPTVGADTQNYQSFFVWISTVPLKDLAAVDTIYWNSSGTELTYKVFNKIVSAVSAHPQTITFVCGLILGILLYKFVMSQSNDPWLSILLFVSLGFFQTAMNIAPSAIAGMCCLVGFRHLQDTNSSRFFLYVVLGCVFHYSAMLFVPIYFLSKREWKIRPVIFCVVLLFILIPFLYPVIIGMLGSVVPSRWVQYLSVDRIDYMQLLVWLVLLALFMFAVVVSNAGDTRDRSNANMMLFVVGLAYALTTCSTSFSRIAILFAPYFIVAIPNYLVCAKPVYQNARLAKLLPEHLKGVHANHAKALLIASVILVYIMRLFVNNIGQTIPYALFVGI